MKPKIYHILIAGLVIFWIVFIGWGMIKTTLQLSKEKALLEEPLSQKPEILEPLVQQIPEQTEITPVLVRTFKIRSTDFSDLLPVMGTVKGKTEIELKFEINGVMKTIHFREGEKIKTGDLIACLDPEDAQLRIAYAKSKFNSAQAAYHSIQKKLEVHQKLFEAGAIIKSKVEEVELESESAKFQVEVVKSEMELAENGLKKTFLYATKDSVMGPREAEEAEFVTPQDKVGSLLEISEVFIEVGVVERDINKIALGQKAKVYVDAYSNITFEGIVDRISPVVEGKSRTLTVKIKVPNPEGLLIPGMFSRAEINLCELIDVLIIPTIALIHAGRGVTLVPVTTAQSLEKREGEAETGTVQLASVKLGYITSDYAEVTEGLQAEDLVVIEAQGELQDNSRVKIIEIEEISF